MARVTTKTGVANLAITLMKGTPVISIDPPDKGSKTAKLAAQWYDDARREALSLTDWDFAIKRVQISASAAPAFGWAYSYQLPSDFVRIATIGDEDDPLTSENYKIENGFILCNENAPLNVRYIYDCEDVTKFSPKFLIAFAKKLSSYMAHGLSGSLNMAAGLSDIADGDMSEAKALDAQQTPPRKYSRSRWAEARQRGHTERFS